MKPHHSSEVELMFYFLRYLSTLFNRITLLQGNKTTEPRRPVGNVWQGIKGEVCLSPIRTDGGDSVRSMLNGLTEARWASLSSPDTIWVLIWLVFWVSLAMM